MKLNINFLQTGGVPLTNDLMQDIMSAIELYDSLGILSGEKTIIAGCNVAGNSVSPGVVSINGEVMFFAGGQISDKVFVDIEDIVKPFQDPPDKTLIRLKTVRFGNGAVEFDWADFFKLKTIKEIQEKAFGSVSQYDFDELKNKVTLLELKTAPIVNGGIAWPWFKPKSEIPAGWKECINIQGKTIVGLDPSDNDFKNLLSTFGTKTTKLTRAQLPDVSLEVDNIQPFEGYVENGAFNGGSQYRFYRNHLKIKLGDGESHNNVQPSLIAYFIEPNLP